MSSGGPRATPDRPRRELGVAQLVAFGAPATGYGFLLLLIQFYFLKFATDVLLLAPVMAGLLIGVGRLWDAVSDPLVGHWSDRTSLRMGRRRPWMLAGTPLAVLFFVWVWSPPEGLGDTGVLVWSAVGLFGFYTAYTLYSVPHTSLGTELSTDHHERSRIFGAQRACFVLGMLLSFGAVYALTVAAEPRALARSLAVGTGLAGGALLLWSPLALPERSEYRGRGADSPFSALGDVLRNPHARVLLLTWLVDGVGAGVLGVLAPYVSQYVLGRPDLVAWLPLAFLGSALLALPAWVLLSRRYGKRNVWRVALVGQALGLGGTTMLAPDQLPLLFALLVVAGACNGCGGMIGQSMLADVIDWDELKSGQRKEGAYSAAWGFALKASIGAVVLVVGVALQLSGFEPNVQQAPAAEWTIRCLFGGLPLCAGLGASWVLGRFALDEAEHERIRSELDARAARARRGE